MSDKPTVFNYKDYEAAQEKIRKQQDIIRVLGDRASMSVSDILEQIKADMCDDYCKWPEKCEGLTEDAMHRMYCDNCPLDRL